MRASDVEALDKLIGDGLRFTLPGGSVIGKHADLEAHRSGATRFSRIEETERKTAECSGGGTTETIARTELSDKGQPIEAMLRWRRTWQLIDPLADRRRIGNSTGVAVHLRSSARSCTWKPSSMRLTATNIRAVIGVSCPFLGRVELSLFGTVHQRL
ncbi:nuclear transport factor 2 family protein [Arthrobacter sp. NPDC055138]